MRQKKIAVNAVLNMIKSGLAIIFPLITYPYVLRVLGTENMGKISYSLSIVSYFALVARFGISTYATREGAKIKEDKEKFTKFANEIFTLNMILTFVAYASLMLVLVFVRKFDSYRILILIQSISMISMTMSVDWVNNIFEDFLSITIRSIISYLVIVVLMFLLVRNRGDYYIYAGITIIAGVIVSAFNWFYCRRYVKVRLSFSKEMRRHLKYMFIFFLSGLTVTIYVNLDTTMLGLMKGDHSVGIYSTATNIYKIIKELLAAIYVVAIPRLALYFGKEDMEEYRKLFSNIVGVISLILLPACVGLICVADGVIAFIGGPQYAEAVLTLQILAVSLMFAIFGGMVTACLNVTIGYEKNNLIATTISALINFTLNLYFIRVFDYNGAAVTTCIAEAFVFIFCFLRVDNRKKYLDFSTIGHCIMHAGIGCISIVALTFAIRLFVHNTILAMFVIMICSGIVYAGELVLVKNSIFMDMAGSFVRRLLRRKKS